MILPLVAYWQIRRSAGTPILPSFYTNYYTQEDRLKAIAVKMARDEAWNELLLNKVNELIEKNNELEARVTALEESNE